MVTMHFLSESFMCQFDFAENKTNLLTQLWVDKIGYYDGKIVDADENQDN